MIVVECRRYLARDVIAIQLRLHDVSDVASVGLQRVDADVIEQTGDQSGRGSSVATQCVARARLRRRGCRQTETRACDPMRHCERLGG